MKLNYLQVPDENSMSYQDSMQSYGNFFKKKHGTNIILTDRSYHPDATTACIAVGHGQQTPSQGGTVNSTTPSNRKYSRWRRCEVQTDEPDDAWKEITVGIIEAA